MSKFKSFAVLEKHIRKKINDTLLDDVASVIKEEEGTVIVDVVYGAYGGPNGEPEVYERRGFIGGLADDTNMVENLIGDGILSITNETEFNPGYGTSNSGGGLDVLVEEGNGGGGHYYDYREGQFSSGSFTQPRPFTQETINRLKANKHHVNALKYGLIIRGLNVDGDKMA